MATANDYITTPLLGVNLQQTYHLSTTTVPYTADYPPFLAGTTVNGTDESAWIFVLASGAIAVGDVVSITNAGVASGITTTNAAFGNQVGVSQVAIADTDYGWVQRAGSCTSINVAGLCAPNVQLAATATAGALDDAVTTGLKNITGIIVTATNTLTTTVAAKAGTLNYPVVGTTN